MKWLVAILLCLAFHSSFPTEAQLVQTVAECLQESENSALGQEVCSELSEYQQQFTDSDINGAYFGMASSPNLTLMRDPVINEHSAYDWPSARTRLLQSGIFRSRVDLFNIQTIMNRVTSALGLNHLSEETIRNQTFYSYSVALDNMRASYWFFVRSDEYHRKFDENTFHDSLLAYTYFKRLVTVPHPIAGIASVMTWHYTCPDEKVLHFTCPYRKELTLKRLMVNLLFSRYMPMEPINSKTSLLPFFFNELFCSQR